MDDLQVAPIIIGKLLNIGGMLQKNGNRMLLPFELNQQQFSVFFEIAKSGKVKQKDMVNRLMLEKAHISKVVKKLESMNLITISSSDEDKRSAWLSPTTEGEEVLKKCMGMFEEWNGGWTSDIESNILNQILDNLTLLQKVFKNRIVK